MARTVELQFMVAALFTAARVHRTGTNVPDSKLEEDYKLAGRLLAVGERLEDATERVASTGRRHAHGRVEADGTTSVKGCSACGGDHEDVPVFRDEKSRYFVCAEKNAPTGGTRVEIAE